MMSWTDERIADLRRHVSNGLTASRIAAELGCSRNAVIGKVHRLGAQLQTPPTSPPKPSTPAAIVETRIFRKVEKRLKIRPGHASQTVREVQVIEPTEVMDLAPDHSQFACTVGDLAADMCRWPIGDSGDLETFRYCGEPHGNSGPYCGRHHAIAYRPFVSNRRRA